MNGEKNGQGTYYYKSGNRYRHLLGFFVVVGGDVVVAK